MLVQERHRIMPEISLRINPGCAGRRHIGEIRGRGRQNQAAVGIRNAQQAALVPLFQQHQMQHIPALLHRTGAEHPCRKQRGAAVHRQGFDRHIFSGPGVRQERQGQHAAPHGCISVSRFLRREDEAVGEAPERSAIRAHADKAMLLAQFVPAFTVRQEDQFLHPHTSFMADCTSA